MEQADGSWTQGEYPRSKGCELSGASSRPCFVAQLLVVFPPALIAASKWLLDICVGILALNVFQGSVHLTRHLVKFFAASPRVQGGFETETIEILVFGEAFPGFRVVGLLGAA